MRDEGQPGRWRKDKHKLMKANKADRDWDNFAKISPYFGVVTWDEFKPENLTEQTITDFFKSGEKVIEMVVSSIRRHLDSSFQPARCLDFGCGVGRLLIPLATRFQSVVGVDIAQAMLEEAQQNCLKRGLENVEFAQSDDELSRVTGKFDFIHSYIVLQHIATQRGEKILKRMIDLLNEDGIAALHFTYAANRTLLKRLKYWMHTSMPLAHNFINLARGRKFNYPYTQINQYDLNRVMEILQENGCEHAYLRFTNHDHLLGLFLMFQKKQVGLVY